LLLLKRETERQREKQTDRQTQIVKNERMKNLPEKQRYTNTLKEIQTETEEIETQTDRETHRQSLKDHTH
jgi:hypothetical protein